MKTRDVRSKLLSIFTNNYYLGKFYTSPIKS